MKKDLQERLIWLNGRIVKLNEATVNVLSPTSQFGTNVFEGICCYWNEDRQQLYVFRLTDHHRRLKNSMKVFRMEEKYSPLQLKEGLIDIIKVNGYREDIMVRQTVFVDGYGSWMSKGPVGMFIAPIPKSRINILSKDGLKCCISSWERISDRNISPRIKSGANYINGRMAQIEAEENGYDCPIFLNNHGKVAETPGSCLFIVIDGVLVTPPVTASILESITRDTIIKFAEDVLKTKVVERDIDRTELYVSDECFICGSSSEIAPVSSIDGIQIGSGSPGKITQIIHRTYLDIVRGKADKYMDWLTPVY
jgi:branched-chain amino acid aminotransferase